VENILEQNLFWQMPFSLSKHIFFKSSEILNLLNLSKLRLLSELLTPLELEG